MVAAKAGAANKFGYIAAHSAIVLVCLGGLADGDLMVRAQTWFNGKVPFSGGGAMTDVPERHRLSPDNPTFRGNLLVPEGGIAGTAVLNQPTGILLQELPFAIELKKFVVDYYSTGMPKLFASDIVIHDRETGAKTETRVEVNHPASYKGIEIYQSSFDDGGSRVQLTGYPLGGSARAFPVEGTIGGSAPLAAGAAGAEALTLEFTGLRVINVENFANNGGSGEAVDVRKVDLRAAIDSRLGAANKTVTKKVLRNIGPSVGYKLRDGAGQAREFNNYMLPVDLGEGVPVFLLGTRDTPSEPFRYLRVPADDKGGLEGFVALRQALADPHSARRPCGATWPRPRIRSAATWSASSPHPPAARWRCLPAPKRPMASRLLACRRFRISWRPTCPRPNAPARAMCWCASSTACCSS